MRSCIGCAALLACVVLTGMARAQGDKEPLTDKQFTIKALQNSHAEAQYSSLADRRASSAKVKEFAQQMVKDHKDLNDRLTQQARNLKIAVVVGLEREKREIYDRLSKLEGQAFDRAYMQQMIQDHQQAVQLFEREAKSARDTDLKAFASNTLPSLRKHLERARAIGKEVGVKGTDR